MSNAKENLSTEVFDSILDVPELLQVIDKNKLGNILDDLLNQQYQLRDNHGVLVCGASELIDYLPVSIEHDFEEILQLRLAKSQEKKRNIAHQLLEVLVNNAIRYTMTSRLHIQAIKDDYQQLAAEHRALEISKAKYKALSEQLEERVQEQVLEIQNTQLKLYKSEKMSAIGQLAAGMAHEINNPIGFIRSNLVLFRDYTEQLPMLKAAMDTGDTQKVRQSWEEGQLDYALEDFPELIAESLEGTARIADIVSSLKDFSNIDHNADVEADINTIVTTTCAVASNIVDTGISIVTDLQELPEINCRPGLIGQAFLSLLVNAADAVDRKNGRIRIETEFQDRAIRIRVIDNGIGILTENLNRVTEPFFTTKDVGKGVGLGLSICQDIVVAHNGSIDITSQPGQGTSVQISLPAG